jgi:excisionase family DNA binding protein
MPKGSDGRRRFMSVEETAEQLAVSTKTIRRWIARGQLHYHRFGRQIRIAEEDLRAFVAIARS